MTSALSTSLTAVELTARQLSAIDSWHRHRTRTQLGATSAAASREARMDLDRRLDVLRVQHDAIVAVTADELRDSVGPVRSAVPLRVVVGHRNAWFADRVITALRDAGAVVLGPFENGATVVGTCVATQADVVLLEERLAMMSGEDVVRAVRAYAPGAFVAVQVAGEDRVGPVLEAGASAAYPRRVAPLDVVADLVGRLAGTRELVDARPSSTPDTGVDRRRGGKVGSRPACPT